MVVSFFRFPKVLPFEDPESQEKLMEEFTDFQCLQDTEIPALVYKKATVSDEDTVLNFLQMDIIWAFLSSMKDSITGQLR